MKFGLLHEFFCDMFLAIKFCKRNALLNLENIAVANISKLEVVTYVARLSDLDQIGNFTSS